MGRNVPEKYTPEFVSNAVAFAIMVFGSLVHATARLKVARDAKDENFTWIDFVILLPIATFSGLVFWLLAKFYFDSEVIHFLAASIGSFMGLAGINKISDAFLELLLARTKK